MKVYVQGKLEPKFEMVANFRAMTNEERKEAAKKKLDDFFVHAKDLITSIKKDSFPTAREQFHVYYTLYKDELKKEQEGKTQKKDVPPNPNEKWSKWGGMRAEHNVEADVTVLTVNQQPETLRATFEAAAGKPYFPRVLMLGGKEQVGEFKANGQSAAEYYRDKPIPLEHFDILAKSLVEIFQTMQELGYQPRTSIDLSSLAVKFENGTPSFTIMDLRPWTNKTEPGFETAEHLDAMRQINLRESFKSIWGHTPIPLGIELGLTYMQGVGYVTLNRDNREKETLERVDPITLKSFGEIKVLVNSPDGPIEVSSLNTLQAIERMNPGDREKFLKNLPLEPANEN